MSKIDLKQLNAIWTAVNLPMPKRQIYNEARILSEIFDTGWMFEHQLEDLCYVGDSRATGYRYSVNLRELSMLLGYNWISTYHRPLMRSISAHGARALSSVDTAAFLMDLEVLGFGFDPTLLVERLRPIITRKKIITNSELDVFWAPRFRLKKHLDLVACDDWFHAERKVGKLPNGSRFEAYRSENGDVYRVDFKGEKYRHQRSPAETRCRECGFTWYRGDPDSSAGHRREHKRRMHVLAPEPLESFLSTRLKTEDFNLVTYRSPAWKHFEMYERAVAFKRELGFDFVQWESAHADRDRNAQGYLMSDEHGRIVGATAFRWRAPDEGSPFWALQWVWVAPTFRRTGILSRYWPMFRERFGDFYVETPISESMNSFLQKRNDEYLASWPTIRIQTPQVPAYIPSELNSNDVS